MKKQLLYGLVAGSLVLGGCGLGHSGSEVAAPTVAAAVDGTASDGYLKRAKILCGTSDLNLESRNGGEYSIPAGQCASGKKIRFVGVKGQTQDESATDDATTTVDESEFTGEVSVLNTGTGTANANPLTTMVAELVGEQAGLTDAQVVALVKASAEVVAKAIGLNVDDYALLTGEIDLIEAATTESGSLVEQASKALKQATFIANIIKSSSSLGSVALAESIKQIAATLNTAGTATNVTAVDFATATATILETILTEVQKTVTLSTAQETLFAQVQSAAISAATIIATKQASDFITAQGISDVQTSAATATAVAIANTTTATEKQEAGKEVTAEELKALEDAAKEAAAKAAAKAAAEAAAKAAAEAAAAAAADDEIVLASSMVIGGQTVSNGASVTVSDASSRTVKFTLDTKKLETDDGFTGIALAVKVQNTSTDAVLEVAMDGISFYKTAGGSVATVAKGGKVYASYARTGSAASVSMSNESANTFTTTDTDNGTEVDLNIESIVGGFINSQDYQTMMQIDDATKLTGTFTVTVYALVPGADVSTTLSKTTATTSIANTTIASGAYMASATVTVK